MISLYWIIKAAFNAFGCSSDSDSEEISLEVSSFGGIGLTISVYDFILSFGCVISYPLNDKEDEDDELAIAFNLVNVASNFARPFSSRFLTS